jgi:hypothetical protein
MSLIRGRKTMSSVQNWLVLISSSVYNLRESGFEGLIFLASTSLNWYGIDLSKLVNSWTIYYIKSMYLSVLVKQRLLLLGYEFWLLYTNVRQRSKSSYSIEFLNGKRCRIICPLTSTLALISWILDFQDLSYVDFSYACLKNVFFSRANLQCAKFRVSMKLTSRHTCGCQFSQFIQPYI